MYDWRGFWARPNQVAPAGDWRFWLVQAGRGFGKTRTGAEWIREESKVRGRLALIGPTAADARDVMVEGESGIMAISPPDNRPMYEPSKRRLTWPNGAMAYCFSADEPERLRGHQHEAGWCDEIAAWRFPDAWDQFKFGLRLGQNPRCVITSTPKPIQLMRDIISDPHTVVTRASTYENRANLAPAFFDSIIRKYEGTRLGRQELLAELLEDIPGALWTRAVIDAYKLEYHTIRWDLLTRIVVAIDPAVTHGENSDETGICVAALARSGHVIVLEDCSCRESPLGWARIAIGAFKRYRANIVAGEVNNGGDLVAANIHAVDPMIPFRAVHASRGKYVRAEPVAALYEQGRVHHVIKPGDEEHTQAMGLLEDQMCTFVPGEKSPDRMDALVWAITELLIDPEQAVVTIPLGLRDYQISAI